MNLELLEKLYKRTEVINKCWIWKGCKGSKGYGQITIEKKIYNLHRLSIVIFHKLEYKDRSWTANHLCNNRECWSPLHVYAGTYSMNQEDIIRIQKTHCVNGHEYTEENSYYNKQGRRFCRACNRGRINKPSWELSL